MAVPTELDISAVMARFFSLSDEVCARWRDDDRTNAPARIAGAMAELASGLDGPERRSTDSLETNGDAHLSRFGDQALILITELAGVARESDMADTASEIELLSIPIVLWAGARGARVRVIGPVVDALAAWANSVREPDALARLYRDMTRINDAIAPEVKEQSAGDPGNPWRVLLLNRAIVATRTHDPDSMEEAYEAVIRHLPDHALRFFEEAMGQMDAIGYPAGVRRMVSRYYERLSAPGTVH